MILLHKILDIKDVMGHAALVLASKGIATNVLSDSCTSCGLCHTNRIATGQKAALFVRNGGSRSLRIFVEASRVSCQSYLYCFVNGHR